MICDYCGNKSDKLVPLNEHQVCAKCSGKNINMFSHMSIPLFKNLNTASIANKLVSVQPLLGPTGLIYYLRCRYSASKGLDK
jgi:hypothetical protein